VLGCLAVLALPEIDEAENLVGFLAFANIGVGVAAHLGIGILGEEHHDAGLTAASFGQIVGFDERMLAEVADLPASAWRTVELDVPHRKYRNPRFHEHKTRPLQRIYRQLFITDLGHDQPTILLTNDTRTTVKNLITRYAKRMLIENALADAVRFFHIDALSSSVGFKVDFDMALLVLASGLYRLMAHRMRGYDDAQARQIFRDLIDMPADVGIADSEITVRFHRRAHLPIVLASGLFDKPVKVPWWKDRPLRFIQ